MLKKFSKFLLLSLLIFIVSVSSFVCYAHENHETNNTTNSSENTEDTTTSDEEPEVHYGDLYLFDNNIVMDKLVDGNVFIFGNDIEITGQVNGNLFVFGNNINFNECVINYSIFACGKSVYYNGICYAGDLYVTANKFEATYNSIVARDIKAVASTAILKSAVYRDVDLISNNADFGKDEDSALIFGDLRYTANKEVTIPEKALGGSDSSQTYNANSIMDIFVGFATCIVTVLSVYIILSKIAPTCIEKISNKSLSVLKLLRYFATGLISIIIVIAFFILLAGTVVGINLAFILVLLFAIIYLVSVPTLTISITNKLKPALKIEKTAIFYLIISLVSVVLYGITSIPYIGGLLGFIITVVAIGLLIDSYIPHKELSDEEKIAIEEAKKQSKENKQKKKQEKLEARSLKKQEKSENKNKDK